MSYASKIALTMCFAIAPIAVLSTSAVAQQGSTLMLNDEVLKMVPRDGSRENGVGQNGYVLLWQVDHNLCVKTSPDLQWRWCINDAGADYTKVAKVYYKDGALVTLAADGSEVWSSPKPGDSQATLHLTSDGHLQAVAPGGNVYWSFP